MLSDAVYGARYDACRTASVVCTTMWKTDPEEGARRWTCPRLPWRLLGWTGAASVHMVPRRGRLLAPAQLRLAERALGKGNGAVAAAVDAAGVPRGRNDLRASAAPAVRLPPRARADLRIYRLSSSGAETTFGYVKPGEIFGELTAVSPKSRESFAKAVRASFVWELPCKAIEDALAAHSGIVLAITKQVGSRLKRIESRVEHLVFRPVPTRVARILLDLAEDFGRQEPHGLMIDLALSQEELATLVGASRQAVNASLREFERAGLIRRDGRRFVLLGVDALRESADGDRA